MFSATTTMSTTMSNPSEAEIRAFITGQVAFWNAGERDSMTALYERHAPSGLVIEYVGQPLGDGWATYNHMWDTYAGQVVVEVLEILVNGNEAACSIRNVRTATGLYNPSIETYRFEDGMLHIRYFHASH